jgi:hypothetical protein
MINEQFSSLTIDITKNLSREEKKEGGIFITPKIIITKLMDSTLTHIEKIDVKVKRILEPSCGTCEIINYCDTLFENVEIDGVEYNHYIYSAIKKLNFINNVKIINMNFMFYHNNSDYDIIIGNPPYFVCSKTDIPEEYHSFCIGRPNIFGAFILHSLSMLRPTGILSFVVPKSFLNSGYYASIRNYIKQTCTILEIIDFEEYNKFIDTDQTTFGLIIQKQYSQIFAPIECDYSVKINNNFVFTTNSIELKKMFEGATTITNMGLKVRTGTIVWNQHKSQLTDDNTNTLLIYNTNITKDNKLVIKKFRNETKCQYIKREGRNDPTLVVNRGNGNSSYNLNYAIIEEGPYLIENHLNEIYSPIEEKKEVLIKKFELITKSFKNPKTKVFIDMFLGNNGLSKTELESVFPIYL